MRVIVKGKPGAWTVVGTDLLGRYILRGQRDELLFADTNTVQEA